jgi:hypothetical protein
VACASRGDLVGLRCDFFLSRLFSFSSPKTSRLNLKKKLCPPIYDLIDFDPSFFITVYLAFDVFSILFLGILFNLIF